jgi:hypothetical protein
MIGSMRRILALSCALPLVALACFSQSSGGGGGGASFDASSDSIGFDSSMPESSSPESSTPEGEAPEAALDAPQEAAPIVDSGVDVQDVVSEPATAPVTVTVVSATGHEMGVPVVFQDDTGKVLGTPTTDKNGVASLVVPAGSSVTVLMGSASSPNLYTVLAVTPGMSFVVPDWFSAPTESAELTSVPSPVPDGGTAMFWHYGGFSTMQIPGPPFAELLSLGNAQPPYAFGGAGAGLTSLVESVTAGGSVLGWADLKNQPLGPLDDAGFLEVNVPGTWNPSVFTENVTIDTGDAGTIAAGSYFEESAGGVLIPLWGGPYTTHPGFADFAQAEADFGPNGFDQLVVTRIPPPAASGSLTVDATNIDTLPVIKTVNLSVPTASQPALSWTLSQGSSASATGIVAQAYWSTSLPEGGTQSGYWSVVAPSNAAGSITAPLLPASAAAYGPVAGAKLTLATAWLVTGGTGIPTYADLVGMAGSFWSIPTGGCAGSSGPFAPPLPAAGTAAFAILAPNSGGGC